MSKLGMVYMGSKRKLAKKIVDKILNDNKKTKYFFDLFGGGGSISFEAIGRKDIHKVHYNELNTGVCELLNKLKKDGVTNAMYQWVDRKTFNGHRLGGDWFSGLCTVNWSFGGHQDSYLYSKKSEPIKKLAHTVCLKKCHNSLKELSNVIGIDIPVSILDGDTKDIRLKINRLLKKGLRLDSLTRMNHLERIAQFDEISKLVITNKSYDDVIIDTPIEETVIYLDPPYENTRQYAEGSFDHRALEEWVKKSPYTIYVSSYNFDLPLVASFNHRACSSATANNPVTENLYCNKINQP